MLPLHSNIATHTRAIYLPLLQEVSYRKVLHDDRKGRQKVEVEQLAAWKFLMFSGSFTTRLYVFQDKSQGVVRESSLKFQPC